MEWLSDQVETSTNQVFDCYQTQEEPRRFVVYEIYDDETAFQAHLSAPMNADVNRRLSAVTEGGSSLTFLTPFAWVEVQHTIDHGGISYAASLYWSPSGSLATKCNTLLAREQPT